MARQAMAQETWDVWADAWVDASRRGDMPANARLHAIILSMLQPVAGTRVLDVGCGEGGFARLLAEHGANVVGMDASARMLEYAREAARGSHGNISYVHADACDVAGLRLEPFDTVVMIMCLMFMADASLAVRACSSVMKPDGRLVVAMTHPFMSAVSREGGFNKAPAHSEADKAGYFVEHVIHATVHDELSIPLYHRPLQEYWRIAAECGLAVRKIAETPPGDGDPRGEATRLPCHLIIECVKSPPEDAIPPPTPGRRRL